MAHIDFSDLDDPLDDLLPPLPGNTIPTATVNLDWSQAEAEDQMHEERCGKCRGTGRFRSYNGRDCGPCFACKGAGKMIYRTSAEERANRRAQAQARREDDRAGNWATFADEHPAEAAWMLARADRFAFAASLKEQVEKRGTLSIGQLAAARKMIAGDAQRAEARAAKVTELDVSGLDAVFAVARSKGAIKAALRTGAITFSLAKATSKNAGAIYAKRPDGEYLGKIMNGRFMPAMECTEADKNAVLEASRDPKGAALRYAAETDRCSVCGKILTDPVSKANRIGPICADNFGW